MKIRHPLLLKVVGFVIACLVRIWIGTVRYRHRSIGPDLTPHSKDLGGRYLYAFWHENMLLPAYHYARGDIWVLISQHADGEMIAEACRHLGFRVVRGSATRGGVKAVLQLLRLSEHGHLAITPDGPRGPRRQVQAGLLYLAAWSGLPIVVGGLGFRRPWRMNSWDRFALPRPWSSATCVTVPPIAVPADADKEQLEDFRRQVEEALLWATNVAEQWAETGRWPEELERQRPVTAA